MPSGEDTGEFPEDKDRVASEFTDSNPGQHQERREPEPLQPGAAVGRYTVLERIGSGGMGVVYAAFDPQLDRRVALKVMHSGKKGTLGSKGRARLLREAQSMAKLSHPNVITVHDVGTLGNSVFVAMEFIEGTTLRDWYGAPRPWQDVVDALVKAGRGLAAAHAAGFVHRDFKPDNVLMGTDGRVLVMDFGLARQSARGAAATDTDRVGKSSLASSSNSNLALTRTGAMLGTPAYMAPEQHRGGTVGPSADQFSFCVALYEGLYGERPFDGTSVTSLAMNVLEGQVRAVPKETTVPSWLRDVVLRGLSVSPTDRFPSMDALLAELQRDPPETRRPWLAAAAMVGVAAMIVGGYLWSKVPAKRACAAAADRIDEVWKESRRAVLKDALNSTHEPFADTTWKSVDSGFEGYATRWKTVYAKSCGEIVAERGNDVPFDDHPALACLDEQRRDFDAILTLLVDPKHAPAVERAVIATQSLLEPTWCANLGRRASAMSEPLRLEDAVQNRVARARALLAIGRAEEAAEIGVELLSIAKKDHASGLEAAAELIRAQAKLALHEPGQAELSLRKAVLAAASDQRAGVEARAWTLLVDAVGMEQGMFDAARRVALAAEAAIARSGNDPHLRGRLLHRLGEIALAQGSYEEALDDFERAWGVLKGGVPPTDLRIAAARSGIGRALEGLERFVAAIEQHNAALALREQVLGAQHPLVSTSLIRLGSALAGDGRDRAAVGALIRARMILDPTGEFEVGDGPLPGPEPPREVDEGPVPKSPMELALCLHQLGIVLRMQESFEQAARLHARAAALIERYVGDNAHDLGYALVNLGLSLADLGNHQDALPHLHRGLDVLLERMDSNHPHLAIAHLNLANSLWATAATQEAQRHYREALAIWEQALPDNHPTLAYALTGLGRVLLELKDPQAALTHLERAMELRSHDDEDRLNVGETSLLLARALWGTNRDFQRAMDLAIVARDAVGAIEPVDHGGFRRVLQGEEMPRFTDHLVPAGLAINNLR